MGTNWPGAVLLSDEIEYYSGLEETPLIYPFDKDQLKPARYQLRLGGEARINGERHKVDDERQDSVMLGLLAPEWRRNR